MMPGWRWQNTMKNKPQLKKVKIDDHIRGIKSSGDKAPARKRGRPRKNHGPDQTPENGFGDQNPSSSVLDRSPLSENPSAPELPAPEIEPVYDTTEEAKAFLRSPFEIAAGATGWERLNLYPAQLEALAPSFKIVYDKRIKPKLGEEADLIAFTMVLSGVIFEKVQVVREERAKLKPKPQPTDSAGQPYIPHEVRV